MLETVFGAVAELQARQESRPTVRSSADPAGSLAGEYGLQTLLRSAAAAAL